MDQDLREHGLVPRGAVPAAHVVVGLDGRDVPAVGLDERGLRVLDVAGLVLADHVVGRADGGLGFAQLRAGLLEGGVEERLQRGAIGGEPGNLLRLGLVAQRAVEEGHVVEPAAEGLLVLDGAVPPLRRVLVEHVLGEKLPAEFADEHHGVLHEPDFLGSEHVGKACVGGQCRAYSDGCIRDGRSRSCREGFGRECAPWRGRCRAICGEPGIAELTAWSTDPRRRSRNASGCRRDR